MKKRSSKWCARGFVKLYFFLETRNLSRSLKHMEMKSGHLLVLLQVSKYLFISFNLYTRINYAR